MSITIDVPESGDSIMIDIADWVWISPNRPHAKRTETACIHGKVRPRLNWTIEDWICGNCSAGNLGERPLVGDECPKCKYIVVRSMYLSKEEQCTKRM